MSESSPGNGPHGHNDSTKPDPVFSSRRNKKLSRNQRNQLRRSDTFEGKCEALKGHIYDVSRGVNRQSETFQKTTREIAEYIGREFDDGGEFRTGLVRLQLPDLLEPVPPSDPNTDKIGFEVWKFEFSRYKKASASRKRNEEKAYALVIGQCNGVKSTTSRMSLDY